MFGFKLVREERLKKLESMVLRLEKAQNVEFFFEELGMSPYRVRHALGMLEEGSVPTTKYEDLLGRVISLQLGNAAHAKQINTLAEAVEVLQGKYASELKEQEGTDGTDKKEDLPDT